MRVGKGRHIDPRLITFALSCLPQGRKLGTGVPYIRVSERYNRSTMVFDDTIPTFDESRFKATDWSAYYPNASEFIPPN